MWLNLQETANLVTFTEKILNGKLFCAVFNDVQKGIVNIYTHEQSVTYVTIDISNRGNDY